MSADTRPDLTGLIDEQARRRFEAAWRTGRPEPIERFLPAEDDPAYQATLEELRDHPPYAQLDRLTSKLADGLTQAAKSAGIPHQLQRLGSMWTLFFTAEPVMDYDSAKRSDTPRFGRFFWAMMDRGVYLPCSQFEAAFVSTAHTEQHIDETIQAVHDALLRMAVPAFATA